MGGNSNRIARAKQRRKKEEKPRRSEVSLFKELSSDSTFSFLIRKKLADRVADKLFVLYPKLHDLLADKKYNEIEKDLQDILLEGLFLQISPTRGYALLGHYYYLWAKVYEHKKEYAKAACAYAKLKFYSCYGEPSRALSLPIPDEMKDVKLMDFAIYRCRALFQDSHSVALNLETAKKLEKMCNANSGKLLEWVVQCKFLLSGNEFSSEDLSLIVNRYFTHAVGDFFSESNDREIRAFKQLFCEMVMFSPLSVEYLRLKSPELYKSAGKTMRTLRVSNPGFVEKFRESRRFMAHQAGPGNLPLKIISAICLLAFTWYLNSQLDIFLKIILYFANVYAIFTAYQASHSTFLSAFNRFAMRVSKDTVEQGAGVSVSWQIKVSDEREQLADNSETAARVSLSLHDIESQQRFVGFEQEHTVPSPRLERKAKRWHTAPCSPLHATVEELQEETKPIVWGVCKLVENDGKTYLLRDEVEKFIPGDAASLVYPVRREGMVTCYIRLNRTLVESSKNSKDLLGIIADFVKRTEALKTGTDSESYRIVKANSLIKFTGNKRGDLRLYGVELDTSECGKKLYELCYAATHKELGPTLDAKVQNYHETHYEKLPSIGNETVRRYGADKR